MGASEAEPGAPLGSKFLVGCLACLGKGQAVCAQGPLSPTGQEEEEDQEGMGPPWGHMGLPRGMGAYPTTWLGLVLCAGSEATLTHSGEAVSPTAPSTFLVVSLSASAVPEGVCPSCCRASPTPPGL